MAVHHEIEDLVSQLNFAAFAVEPESVEQLPPEIRMEDLDRDSNGIRLGDWAFTDEREALARDGASDDVAPPVAPGIFGYLGTDSDDDRDLLVIEEDLPIGGRDASPSESPYPPIRVAPYNQLFAKLRK